MKRTIYADKDGMYNRLMAEWVQATEASEMKGLPRYKLEFWRGKAEGLRFAANMISDWAGEEEPDA